MKQEVICEKSRHLILLVPFGTLHGVFSRELRRTFDTQSADFYYGRGCLLENYPFQVRYHSTILGILLTFLFRYLSLKESLQISFL